MRRKSQSIVRRTLSGAVLALALLSAAPALAQSSASTPFDPREDARVRIGHIYMTPTMTLSDVGVDTNVFNTATDPKSDVTATLTPRLATFMPIVRRGLITATVHADLVYFKTFASERSIDPGADIRGEAYFQRLTLFAADNVLRTRQRASYEIDARSQRFENRAQAGFSVDVKPKLALELSGYQNVVRYDQDELFFGTSLSEALNRTEQGLRLALHQRLTSLTSLHVAVESVKERFDSSPIRNADGYRILPGVSFGQKALIKGSAEVGFRHFDALDASVPDFSGLVANTDLSYTIAGATMLGVNLSRDIDYSYQLGEPYYVATGIGGRVRRQIAGRVDGIFGVNRYVYDYEAAHELTAESLPSRQDVTLTYSVDLGYRANRDVRIGFVVSKWQRDSNRVSSRDYNGVRAGVSVTYGL